MATAQEARRVWFITGATRGFGAQIATAALAVGDAVVATGRDAGAVAQALGEHQELLAVRLDVTDERSIAAAVDAALVRFGRVDILVNNAGFGLIGAVEEASAEEVRRIYETNVFGLLNVTRAVLPHMRRQHAGHVINMSSVGGYRAIQGYGIYSSTKFAVEAISEALYVELGPLGVRVTVVEPGYFRTDFLDASSLVQEKRRIDDYQPTAGKMREAAQARNHQQAGDPARLAQALLEIVRSPAPPLRLPLGTDTVGVMEAKNAFVRDELQTWRTLATSTDFPLSTTR